MRIIDVYPKDVHVTMEMSIREIKMLKDFVEKAIPFYEKVTEDYPESSFLEHVFLPQARTVIEQTEQFSK